MSFPGILTTSQCWNSLALYCGGMSISVKSKVYNAPGSAVHFNVVGGS